MEDAWCWLRDREVNRDGVRSVQVEGPGWGAGETPARDVIGDVVPEPAAPER